MNMIRMDMFCVAEIGSPCRKLWEGRYSLESPIPRGETVTFPWGTGLVRNKMGSSRSENQREIQGQG